MLGPVLILLCSILWASDAYFRLPLAHLPQEVLNSRTIVLLEHAIGVLATLPLFLFRGKEVRSLGTKGWIGVGFVGVIGSAVGTILFTASYRYVNPSVTILLQKMQPVLAVAGARVLLGEKPKKTFYGWAGIAIVASTMVSLPELWSSSQAWMAFEGAKSSGILLALGAAAAWALSTVFGKWITAKVSFPVTTFLRYLTGFLALLMIAATSANVSLKMPEGHSQAIIFMALIPGVSAMYLYYAGLKRTKASVATFCEMFFPIAAIAFNWKILGQSLIPLQIAGALLLMLAVFFISRK